VNAWLALRFPELAIYLNSMRECYEAFVVFNFFTYMMLYLRRLPTFDTQILHKPPVAQLGPLRFCLRSVSPGLCVCISCVHLLRASPVYISRAHLLCTSPVCISVCPYHA
jgi:hypothetical protein